MLNRIATAIFFLSFILPGGDIMAPGASTGIGWDYMEGSFNLMRMIFESSGESEFEFGFQAYVIGFSWIANIGFLAAAAQRHFKGAEAAKWTRLAAIASAALGTSAVLLFCTEEQASFGLAPVGWSLALVLGAVASFKGTATASRS